MFKFFNNLHRTSKSAAFSWRSLRHRVAPITWRTKLYAICGLLCVPVYQCRIPNDHSGHEQGIQFIAVSSISDSSKYSKENLVKNLFVTASSLIVLGVGTLITFQNKLVYKPVNVWKKTPKDYGLSSFEDISVKVIVNGQHSGTTEGWFLKKSKDAYDQYPTMIYFHGRDKNASFRLKKCIQIHRHVSCNILLLSYRGYGRRKTGNCVTEESLKLDSRYILRYLRSRNDITQKKFWIFGESLGGAVALDLAAAFPNNVRGVIVENTFLSMDDVIKTRGFPFKYLRHFSINEWNSNKKVQQIKKPILFLSGLQDDLISPNMMRTMFYQSVSSLSQIVTFPTGGHNNTWNTNEYFEAIGNFVHKVEENDKNVFNQSKKFT